MRWICLVALAGCSQILGIDELSGPSGANPDAQVDAPPDGPPPPTIRLSGTAVREGIGGTQPNAGVVVEYFSRAEVRQAMATTDATGAFMLDVPTNGAALDGYLHAAGPQTQGVTTDMYLARPVSADTANLTIRMIEQQALDFIAGQCGAVVDPNRAIVAVLVQDASGDPVSGATIDTQPGGRNCSLGSGGFPTQSSTTGANGIVLAFEVPAGSVIASITVPLSTRTVTAKNGIITIVPLVF